MHLEKWTIHCFSQRAVSWASISNVLEDKFQKQCELSEKAKTEMSIEKWQSEECKYLGVCSTKWFDPLESWIEWVWSSPKTWLLIRCPVRASTFWLCPCQECGRVLSADIDPSWWTVSVCHDSKPTVVTLQVPQWTPDTCHCCSCQTIRAIPEIGNNRQCAVWCRFVPPKHDPTVAARCGPPRFGPPQRRCLWVWSFEWLSSSCTTFESRHDSLPVV